MSEIYIYDISDRSWSSVSAKGVNGTPKSRRDGCSVMKTAPDNTSYNIHIQGGIANNDGSILGDIWILTIPSFIWINITTGINRCPSD